MADLLTNDAILVKERARLFKFANLYDLVDQASGRVLGAARERPLSFSTRLFRFFFNRTRVTPITLDVVDIQGEHVFTIRRPWAWQQSQWTYHIVDGRGAPLGSFRRSSSRSSLLRDSFDLLDARGIQQGIVQMPVVVRSATCTTVDQQPLATITRMWPGWWKALCTTADHFAIQFDSTVTDRLLRTLVLAAALCIDMHYWEPR